MSTKEINSLNLLCNTCDEVFQIKMDFDVHLIMKDFETHQIVKYRDLEVVCPTCGNNNIQFYAKRKRPRRKKNT